MTPWMRWSTHSIIKNSFRGFFNSIDIKKDIERLDLISTRLINNLGNNEAYALRAMTEVHIFSKDCKKSIELVEKALNLKPSVDIYTIAGGIYFVCNKFQKTLEYQKKALFLMPNDNGFFVTKQYVATLYMLDKNEEIINVLKSKIAKNVPSTICIVTPITISFIVTWSDSINVGSWNKYVNWPKPKNILGNVGDIGQMWELTNIKYING